MEMFDSSKASSDNITAQQKQSKSDFSIDNTPYYAQGKPRIPTCTQYGKNHYSTCRRASIACFNCGRIDHKVKDCPNPYNALSLKTEGSFISVLSILLKLIEVKAQKHPRSRYRWI